MKKICIFCIFFAFASCGWISQAWGWGGQGHRLVARIAETELSPQAQREVSRLLADEAVPTLAGIASWADELREHDPSLGKQSAHWHYVNMAEHGCVYDQLRDCPGGDCVIEALKAQIVLLADRGQSDVVRRQALKFVVHLVGDVHQPMHAGYAHDKGGNGFQLQYDGKGSNLHAFWDSGLLRTRKLSDDAYLQNLLQLPGAAKSIPAMLTPAVEQWAEASCRVATTPGVYPLRHVLPTDYVDRYRPLAEAALRQAGDRLAAILNAALAAPYGREG